MSVIINRRSTPSRPLGYGMHECFVRSNGTKYTLESIVLPHVHVRVCRVAQIFIGSRSLVQGTGGIPSHLLDASNEIDLVLEELVQKHEDVRIVFQIVGDAAPSAIFFEARTRAFGVPYAPRRSLS